MSALSDAAHELGEQEISVFPLRPRTKVPAIKEWQTRATTSSAQIDRYWRKWPEANIGVLAGDGLMVLDIDSAEADEYATKMGLPDTPTVKTSRGRHLWFEGEGKGSKGTIFPCIDLQGAGTYVVAPPSVHPDTGALYEWITDPDCPLALLPEWALEAPETVSQAFSGGDGKLVEGERNECMHKLASAMRGISMEGEEIETALRKANEIRCEPPLDDDEISKTVASVIRYPVGSKPDLHLLAVERMTTKPSSLAIYIAIHHACGFSDRCELSKAKMHEMTGKCNEAIVDATTDLENVGLVEVIRRQIRGIDKCNEYRLLELAEDRS
jgi:hypothetical protein